MPDCEMVEKWMEVKSTDNVGHGDDSNDNIGDTIFYLYKAIKTSYCLVN